MALRVCNDGHAAVWHEGNNRECPACHIQEALDSAEDEVKDLKDQIADLKDQIADLKEGAG